MRSSWLVVLAACGGAAKPVPAPHVETVATPPTVAKPVTTVVTPARPACDQPDLSALTGKPSVVGAVCDAGNREWLAGVTIILSADESVNGRKQTTITDERGVFDLNPAPGDYALWFYYADVTEKRAIHVSSTQSSPIVQALDLRQASP